MPDGLRQGRDRSRTEGKDNLAGISVKIPYNVRAIRPGPSTRNAMTSKLIQQARAAQPDGRFRNSRPETT